MDVKGLDYWRSYFRTANSDIFDILENGIMVAASDCPKEFKFRRDRIAELLFSCKLTRCSGCERVELAVPGGEDIGGGGVACDKSEFGRDVNEFVEAGGSKESKVNSVSRDDHVGEMMMKMDQQVSNYSYGEAEALTDEIEEESQIFEEVLRIKEILFNSQDESDAILYESLRKLQLMALTVDTLKATEIGKAVNGLRKHGAKEIRHLARTLIDLWKEMVDEWVNATAAIAEGTPDSVNPSAVDEEEEEEGLPSPPLDEGAFFATSQTTMELSQFFDGMDDDGNPRNGGELNKNRESGRKSSVENQITAKRKQQPPKDVNVLSRDNKEHQLRKQEAIVKPNKPSNTQSGPGRPPRVNMDRKVNNETKYQQKSEKVTVQRKPGGQQEKFKSSDEVAVQVKLEATKRKLQESYQQAENAKKQRTIQVMELQDLPRQGLVHRNPNMKPGNHNRHWANGRR